MAKQPIREQLTDELASVCALDDPPHLTGFSLRARCGGTLFFVHIKTGKQVKLVALDLDEA